MAVSQWLTDAVTAIDAIDLPGLKRTLSRHPTLLSNMVPGLRQDVATALFMAVFARFRDEKFSVEETLQLTSSLLDLSCTWRSVRIGLIKSIPCSGFTSTQNCLTFGALLFELIRKGLSSDRDLEAWAGGWLAYYLRNSCWDRLLADKKGWETTACRWTGLSDYKLPAALVSLGARKDATPAWGREQYTARSYAIKTRDPVLRYIVMYDEYGQRDKKGIWESRLPGLAAKTTK